MKYSLDDGAFAPEYAHDTDAGMDLRSPLTIIAYAHSAVVIDTGIHIDLPEHTVGMLKSKSGLNVKYNILNEGVIDESYSGSIRVKLYNHGENNYMINRGDKISQLVVLPYLHVSLEEVDSIEERGRGDNGFGSTGK